MAYDGNGNFVRLYNWQQDAANGIDITASRVDAEDSGFAAGLSNAVTRDGQGKMGADFLPATDNAYALGNGSKRWATFNGANALLIPSVQAVKTANTDRLNTSTPSDDPDLIITLGVGTWRIEAVLFFNAQVAGNSPGLQAGFHFAGTCTLTNWVTSGSANGAAFNPFVLGTPVAPFQGSNQTQSQSFAAQGQTGLDAIMLLGTLPVTVGGTLAVSWSQFQISPSAVTTLHLNSFLTARRLI